LSWYELWLFLHVSGAVVWIGGATMLQVFGVLTARAADPAKSAFFARSAAWTVLRVFLPAAVVILGSGIALVERGNWDWGEPFIVFGLAAIAAVSLVAFGYLGGAMRRAGMQLESEGPSPALGLRVRNLVWLSRLLLAVLAVTLFMMTVKLGT
jgi:uncharacterized membrane protein